MYLIKYTPEHHLKVSEGASFQGSSSRGKFKVGMKMRDH